MDSQYDTGFRDRGESSSASSSQNEMKIVDDLVTYFRKYAHECPEKLALACLGVGFILGWKLKPW